MRATRSSTLTTTLPPGGTKSAGQPAQGPHEPMSPTRSSTLTMPLPAGGGAMSAGQLLHRSRASSAQMPSHATVQQNRSTAHTVAQQSKLLQPGVPSGTKYLPLAGLPQPAHMESASLTQMPSQAVSQQNGSAAQTVLQQSASLQKGEPLLA